MADDPQTRPEGTATPPAAAADKPASPPPGEPPGGLKAEVSRTDAPGAGASAAPVGAPRTEPPAPKPANPEAAVTATTSETSSATGQPTAPAAAAKPAAAPTKPLGAEAAPAPAAKAAAPAAKAPHVPPPPAAPTGPPDPAPPADKPVPGFITALQSQIAGGVSAISFYLGDWTVIVPVAKLIEVLRHLRDASDARFDYLSDLTATDWPPRKEGRFDVLYMLYSTVYRHRVRVKVIVAENQ